MFTVFVAIRIFDIIFLRFLWDIVFSVYMAFYAHSFSFISTKNSVYVFNVDYYITISHWTDIHDDWDLLISKARIWFHYSFTMSMCHGSWHVKFICVLPWDNIEETYACIAHIFICLPRTHALTFREYVFFYFFCKWVFLILGWNFKSLEYISLDLVRINHR